MSAASGFGYPMFKTLAMCVPWSGRPLPPELPVSFKSCVPPMNTNTVFFQTTAMMIADARNFFCEQAIAHNAKWIFMWDEDVLLPAHAIRELIYVAESWPDAGVVAGIYCLKCEHPQPMVFRGDPGTGVYWDWKVGEVFECSATGLGCSLIVADALKDIPKPWFRTVDNMDPYLDNVPMGEGWSEDLYFAEGVKKTKWKWIAHGGLVMPHVDIKTGYRYELPHDSKPARHLAVEVGKKKILDIGCGTSPMKTDEGKVLTIDAREEVHPDYRGDFRRMPFATGEFSIVHSAHTLEHVARNEVESTLEEWIRVLAPNGELRLFVPNLEWACKRILAGQYDVAKGTDVSALDALYGQQAYPLDFHKTGFTPKMMEDLLKKFGFKYVLMQTPLFHLHVRAWRKRPKDWDKFKLECDKYWEDWHRQNDQRFIEDIQSSNNGNGANHAIYRTKHRAVRGKSRPALLEAKRSNGNGTDKQRDVRD